LLGFVRGNIKIYTSSRFLEVCGMVRYTIYASFHDHSFPLRSPDSSSILAQSESHSMHLFTLNPGEDGSSSSRVIKPIGFHVQSTPILSSKWFPTASLTSPETFCYVLSTREMPVKLIDGLTGRVSIRNYYKKSISEWS
jgi:hypothetical protein